jgi:hypothetical protein
MRLRCANNISVFFRSRREVRPFLILLSRARCRERPHRLSERVFDLWGNGWPGSIPSSPPNPTGEGTGLGLSMTYDIIIKQHGGGIDVETEPGALTEFITTLPRGIGLLLERTRNDRFWPILLKKSAVTDGSLGHFAKHD